jgi:hypothetical protein
MDFLALQVMSADSAIAQTVGPGSIPSQVVLAKVADAMFPNGPPETGTAGPPKWQALCFPMVRRRLVQQAELKVTMNSKVTVLYHVSTPCLWSFGWTLRASNILPP